MIKYFVFYSSKENNGRSYEGNVDVTRNEFIQSIEDIRSIERDIAEKFNYEKVVIKNYIEMKGISK